LPSRKDKAYGIIAIQWNQGHWETFIVKHQKGHWSFPKGHAEVGETPQETAAREMEEETGAKLVRFLDTPPLKEEYTFKANGELIEKMVTYFLAEVEDAGSHLQEKEIIEGKWLPFEEAEKLITFAAAKKLCKEAEKSIKSSNA